MEISRNIITLYLLDEDILKLNNNILSSIKSSYSIYLKKNVDRYIRALKELQDLGLIKKIKIGRNVSYKKN